MSTPSQTLIPPPTTVNNTHKNYVFGTLCAVMGALGTLGVIGRLTIRYHFRNLGADDYAIIPATVLFFAWTTMASWLCLNVGVGKPLWEITIDEFSMWLNGQVACVWLYPAMSASIRISILFFYRRIFRVDERTDLLIWWLLGLQGVYVIAFSIAPGWLCSDFHFSFSTWATVCSFQYFKVLQTCLYTISLALDLILFLFPIYPMRKIQLKNTQQTKAAVIFGFGLAATVVAAYKLGVSVKEWVHILPADSPFWKYQVSLFVPGQYSDYGTAFWIPSVLEPTIAIMAASLPAFRQLYRNLTDSPQVERSYYTDSLLNSHSSVGGQFIHLSGTEIELEDQHK